ncbi:GNAT family N-acetyltransferase, partial [Gemmatimonas sp.]|uniref:GNAT family N-acetyltransferase n=1 Tax=Gemmatimonas sp. TaxID=1962908 RepID=UPI00356A3ECB
MSHSSKDLRVALADRSVADALRSCAMPLGCPVGFLERHRVASVERLGDDEPVVRTFVRDAVGVVSVPCDEEVDLGLDPADVQELITLTRLEAAPGSVIELRGARLTVGDDPAAVALLDECTIAPSPRVAGMLVYDPRRDVLDMLRHDVSPWEWNEGGGNVDSPHRVGALQGGVLVALATVDAPDGRLARVRVLVSPRHRRMGYGRVVLDALVRHVLSQGFIPFVRLAVGDLAARALASTVGFVSFARSLTLHVTHVGSDVQTELP